MADAIWPSEDADGNEHGNEDNQPERAIGSGPLVDPAQITSTLSARLVRRWTLPLGRHRERHERGDTDEVETLSPSDAHLLGRFLAQPPTGYAVEGTSPLPGIEQVPTIPARVPTPPSGALTRRFAARTARTALAPAPPAVTPPAPLDVARLAMRSFHLAVAPDGFLPADVLMLLDGHTRRLWLAPLLLLLMIGSSADWRTRLAATIEARPLTRYLIAALWAVTHSEMPASSPAAASLTVLFAPAAGLTRHPWHRWHGSWYTRVWRQTNRLVAPHLTLDRLTACYLGLREGERVPHLGPERRRAVLENALRVLPHLRARCRTTAEMERAAWAHYTGWLARVTAVPECVIADRLDGDRRAIRAPDDLCRLTDDLLAGEPEMAHARTMHAHGVWSETSRGGVYRTAGQGVALWLAEPS